MNKEAILSKEKIHFNKRLMVLVIYVLKTQILCELERFLLVFR